MKLVLSVIVVITITNSLYCQNGISLQNSASSSVSARIWGPEDIKKLDYDSEKSTLIIGNSGSSLFYLETKLPDTLVNVTSNEKVGVKCELKETVAYGVTAIRVETTFEPVACGVYTNKELVFYSVHYN